MERSNFSFFFFSSRSRPTRLTCDWSSDVCSSDLDFIGECLIMNKGVGAGRADGLFVEALGIEVPALQTGDLGSDQRGAVLKIVRAIRRPHLELFVMRRKSLHVLLPLSGWRGIAEGGLG